MKAKAAKKPRIPKTWRIRQDIIKKIEKIGKSNTLTESEVIEEAVLALERSCQGIVVPRFS